MPEVSSLPDADPARPMFVILLHDPQPTICLHSDAERTGSAIGLVRGAVRAGGGRERDDLPFSVLFVEAEEISTAMNEPAIDEEVEGSPNDRQIVVDPNLWIMHPFLDVCGPRGRHAVGEVLHCDLAEATFHHER